jgi:hypothetical protein
MSEQKLYDLDAPTGARESGSALLRGVLVREAVKSAWSSIDDGSSDEMTNWKSETAMGLDVIGEDEEEEQDEQEEKWFEDLLSSLGEEEQPTTSAEWVESEVLGVDDELYDVDEMEAYTIPLPPSPPVQPKLPVVESIVQRLAAPVERITIDSLVTVDAVEDVDDDDAASDCSDCSMCRSIAAHLDGEFPSAPAPPSTPITRPISTCDPASGAFEFEGRAIPDVFECDDDDDDMLLPPPLHRSWSSDSTDSFDDDVCRTPPTMSCEELEEEAYWTPSKAKGEVDDALDTALRLVF